MIVTIDIKDNVTPALAEKAKQLAPNRLAQEISEPLRVFWSRHMRGLGTNKRGWPSTGFWEQAADQTQAIVNGPDLILRCTKTGVRQRYLGGRIEPQKAGALTIPISPVSYGKRASEFSGLFLIKTRKGAYLVQRGETLAPSGNFKQTKEIGRGRKKNEARRLKAGLNFLFKLSAGVNQKANPDVVPSADEFSEVAMGAIERSLA